MYIILRYCSEEEQGTCRLGTGVISHHPRPQNSATTIPIHKNAPNEISESFLMFPKHIPTRQYPPAMRTAYAKARIFSLTPSNTPETAISFTSPAPNECGFMKSMSSNPPLTQRLPAIRFCQLISSQMTAKASTQTRKITNCLLEIRFFMISDMLIHIKIVHVISKIILSAMPFTPLSYN